MNIVFFDFSQYRPCYYTLPLTTESPTTHYCTVQHHVPIDPYAERMPREDCSATTPPLVPAWNFSRSVVGAWRGAPAALRSLWRCCCLPAPPPSSRAPCSSRPPSPWVTRATPRSLWSTAPSSSSAARQQAPPPVARRTSQHAARGTLFASRRTRHAARNATRRAYYLTPHAARRTPHSAPCSAETPRAANASRRTPRALQCGAARRRR